MLLYLTCYLQLFMCIYKYTERTSYKINLTKSKYLLYLVLREKNKTKYKLPHKLQREEKI